MKEIISSFARWLGQGIQWALNTMVTICSWGIDQITTLLNRRWRINVTPDQETLIIGVVTLLVIGIIIYILSKVWDRFKVVQTMISNAIGTLISVLVLVTVAIGTAGVIALLINTVSTRFSIALL